MSYKRLQAIKTQFDTVNTEFESKQQTLITERDRLYAQLAEAGGEAYDLDSIKATRDIRRDIEDVEQALQGVKKAWNKAINDLGIYHEAVNAKRQDENEYDTARQKKLDEFISDITGRIGIFLKEIDAADSEESSEFGPLQLFVQDIINNDNHLDDIEKNNLYSNMHHSPHINDRGIILNSVKSAINSN